MEEALRKATDEAHKQRLALEVSEPVVAAVVNAPAPSFVQSQSKALTELQQKQEVQQQELLKQLETEEKQRQDELQ